MMHEYIGRAQYMEGKILEQIGRILIRDRFDTKKQNKQKIMSHDEESMRVNEEIKLGWVKALIEVK